jgi:hypothetical protein
MALGKYALGLTLLGYVIYRNWDGLVEAVSRPINFVPFAITALFVSMSAAGPSTR